MLLFNPIVISVLVLTVLCLFKLPVLAALLLAALTAGLAGGFDLTETMTTFIGGMGGNANTALSYILLGALAYTISKTGAADILAKKISPGAAFVIKSVAYAPFSRLIVASYALNASLLALKFYYDIFTSDKSDKSHILTFPDFLMRNISQNELKKRLFYGDAFG